MREGQFYYICLQFTPKRFGLPQQLSACIKHIETDLLSTIFLVNKQSKEQRDRLSQQQERCVVVHVFTVLSSPASRWKYNNQGPDISFILILQYNMWNSGFFYNLFPLYYLQPTPPPPLFPPPEPIQSQAILQKENQTIDLSLQNPTVAVESQSKSVLREGKGPRGNGRRLSARQKLRRRRLREDNFERKKQKKDRNIPSNIIKNLFALLDRHQNLAQFLKSRAPHASFDLLQKLALKLKAVIHKQGTYVRPKVLQALWNQEGLSKQEGVVVRVMLRHFFVITQPMILVRRECFRKAQKLEYLKCCRRLWAQLQDNYFI